MPAGFALGNEYVAGSATLDPISIVVLITIVAWYLYRVLTFRTGRLTKSSHH